MGAIWTRRLSIATGLNSPIHTRIWVPDMILVRRLQWQETRSCCQRVAVWVASSSQFTRLAVLKRRRGSNFQTTPPHNCAFPWSIQNKRKTSERARYNYYAWFRWCTRITAFIVFFRSFFFFFFENSATTLIAQVMKWCYSYDPQASDRHRTGLSIAHRGHTSQSSEQASWDVSRRREGKELKLGKPLQTATTGS